MRPVWCGLHFVPLGCPRATRAWHHLRRSAYLGSAQLRPRHRRRRRSRGIPAFKLFNIVLFVPLGFIALNSSEAEAAAYVGVGSFAATCLIETAQFTGLSERIPSRTECLMDDLICNTLSRGSLTAGAWPIWP